MERHNTKIMEQKGIFKELLAKKFIKDDKVFMFYSWTYKNKILSFYFRNENDINKSFYATNVENFVIDLWCQHYGDYENTLNLIYKEFDKIEEIQK